jgi:hypothetical protein
MYVTRARWAASHDGAALVKLPFHQGTFKRFDIFDSPLPK